MVQWRETTVNTYLLHLTQTAELCISVSMYTAITDVLGPRTWTYDGVYMWINICLSPRLIIFPQTEIVHVKTCTRAHARTPTHTRTHIHTAIYSDCPRSGRKRVYLHGTLFFAGEGWKKGMVFEMNFAASVGFYWFRV